VSADYCTSWARSEYRDGCAKSNGESSELSFERESQLAAKAPHASLVDHSGDAAMRCVSAVDTRVGGAGSGCPTDGPPPEMRLKSAADWLCHSDLCRCTWRTISRSHG